ncbi:hypothetical protein GLP24_04315 [Photobacterium carnosum]|uniref:hypothetical protein n=1 Tax=Photobacterium carnosum TaxID=2023717 RepID=UPI001E629A5C|nr:hypothetical protein [Photobacterium carnosum]MCD9544075.1 hypothetical protein [Photobacterium carnosum]
MVKELLVNETLTDTMIKSGAQLIRELDKQGADVSSAFWFYVSEEEIWKLIFVSQKISEEGPRSYYKRIMEANKKLGRKLEKISLNDIGVSSLDHGIVQLLRMMIQVDGLGGVRFSKNTINGHYIDDVYIYRMK